MPNVGDELAAEFGTPHPPDPTGCTCSYGHVNEDPDCPVNR